MKFISYAQNFEDILLWRALQAVENGFYIDIGAQDPVIDSVSYGFYLQGWRGVHIEPSPQYAGQLRVARQDEVVEELLISDSADVSEFFVIADTGLSTAHGHIAEQHAARGFTVTSAQVPSLSLDALLEKYGSNEVHWLKVDVEGSETHVISSWKESTVRPWILVIESTVPMTNQPNHEKWDALIREKGYEFVYFDGLNRFYLHSAHMDLMHHFASPPNVFDDVALSGLASNSLCAVLNQQLAEYRASVERLRLDVMGHQTSLTKLQTQLNSTVKALEDMTGRTKLLEEREISLNNEINWLTQSLNNTHEALHRILTSKLWKATYPVRFLIDRWPSSQFARLHPRRVRNSMIRRTKLTVLSVIALVGKFPKLKALGVLALRRTGAYESIRSRYVAYLTRSREQLFSPFEFSDLGQRASYIYADLLRRKKLKS